MPLSPTSRAHVMAIEIYTKPSEIAQVENVVAGSVPEDERVSGFAFADYDGAILMDDDGSFLTE